MTKPVNATDIRPRTMFIKKWAYIPSSTNGSHIEFTVLVRDTNVLCKDPQVYEISKRFSQFHALHKSLRQEGFSLPEMPMFDIWTNVLIKIMPDNALKERQIQLQHILDSISSSIEMQRTFVYKEFIRPPNGDSKWRYTSLSDIRIHPGQMIQTEQCA